MTAAMSSSVLRCYRGNRWVRREGFEPPTRGLEGRRSVHLSYRRENGRRGHSTCGNEGDPLAAAAQSEAEASFAKFVYERFTFIPTCSYSPRAPVRESVESPTWGLPRR
jgi:hypothetical protein